MKKNMKLIVIIIAILIGIILFPFIKKTLPTSPSSSTPDKVPSEILDITNWKLTLPTGSDEEPIEIKQPALNNFQIDPWFIVNTSSKGIQFRAPVNGVTTGGSNYPRSELREMSNNGKTNASWSSNSGTHEMIIDEAIMHVPKDKPHVVAGQIHDDSDDIIVVRLEYPNLYINVDGKNKFILDDNYKLGKRFTIQFIVNNDQTKMYYNKSKDPVYILNKNYSGAYFKAGVYTQSNCSKENICNNNNYGEVMIYNVQVSHN